MLVTPMKFDRCCILCLLSNGFVTDIDIMLWELEISLVISSSKFLEIHVQKVCSACKESIYRNLTYWRRSQTVSTSSALWYTRETKHVCCWAENELWIQCFLQNAWPDALFLISLPFVDGKGTYESISESNCPKSRFCLCDWYIEKPVSSLQWILLCSLEVAQNILK